MQSIQAHDQSPRVTGRRPSARALALAGAPILLALAIACADSNEPTRPTARGALAAGGAAAAVKAGSTPVTIEVFAPENGSRAGIGGAGWFIDMEIDFATQSLTATGFNGFQISGPGGHANIPPFPSPGAPGHDDKLPGLVVLCSTSTFPAGAGQNLAGLFNLTGVTNRDASETELWDTWLVAGPACGVNKRTHVFVAVVDDLNHDGIYNDAPDVVQDLNHDGRINAADLTLLGLASNIVEREFTLAP